MSGHGSIEPADDERCVGEIVIRRIIDGDGGMRDLITVNDGDGDHLDMPTAVGMLTIASHTLICECDTHDDEDEDE